MESFPASLAIESHILNQKQSLRHTQHIYFSSSFIWLHLVTPEEEISFLAVYKGGWPFLPIMKCFFIKST